MFSFRIILSWIVSSIVMYLAFYLWHGFYLNELSTLDYPKSLFYFFSALTYLGISFLIIRLYDFKLFKKYIPNLFTRGLASGIVVGILVFLISHVTGVGIGKSVTFQHLILDATWQCTEQCVGGILVALGNFFIFDPSTEENT